MSAKRKSAGDPVAASSSVEQHGPGNGGESPVNTAGCPSFFELGARYLIAPEATLAQLVNDLGCLFESGIGGIEAEPLDDFTAAQWAGMYTLRQAGAVAEEIQRRLFAGECIERGQA